MKQKYILIKGKGGLGNRLLCAASGILYAELTGRTPFIDWRDSTYTNGEGNAFYELYNVQKPDLESFQDKTIYPSIWQGSIDRTVSDIVESQLDKNHDSLFIHRKLSIDVRDMKRPEDILVFWNYSHRINQLKPLLRNHGLVDNQAKDTESIIRASLRKHFTPKRDILDRAAKLESDLFDTRTLAVHVRYTDLKVNLDKAISITKDTFKRGGFTRIFLATDNPIVIKVFESNFPIVVTTPKWFPEANATLHQNSQCDNRLSAAKEAIIDQILLSRAAGLIYSSLSTFSWLAAIQSDAAREYLIDLDKWNIKRQIKRAIRDMIP